MTNLDQSAVAGITRGNLRERTILILKRGGWSDPDVLLVRGESGVAVVKDFSPRSRFTRAALGPFAISREVRALRSLADCRSVPNLLGQLDGLAFAVEHRGGPRLSRRRPWTFSSRFVANLQAAIREMHARGVVHLDLSHRDNVRADMQGEVVLVDFANDRWRTVEEALIWNNAPAMKVAAYATMALNLKFGQASVLRLDNDDILATHWAIENGQGRILTHRLRVSG